MIGLKLFSLYCFRIINLVRINLVEEVKFLAAKGDVEATMANPTMPQKRKRTAKNFILITP